MKLTTNKGRSVSAGHIGPVADVMTSSPSSGSGQLLAIKGTAKPLQGMCCLGLNSRSLGSVLSDIDAVLQWTMQAVDDTWPLACTACAVDAQASLADVRLQQLVQQHNFAYSPTAV
jgi:hypothetical protein